MILTELLLVDKSEGTFKTIDKNGYFIIQQDENSYIGKVWQDIQKQNGKVLHQSKYRLILNTALVQQFEYVDYNKENPEVTEKYPKYNNSGVKIVSPIYDKTFIVAISENKNTIKHDFEYLSSKIEAHLKEKNVQKIVKEAEAGPKETKRKESITSTSLTENMKAINLQETQQKIEQIIHRHFPQYILHLMERYQELDGYEDDGADEDGTSIASLLTNPTTTTTTSEEDQKKIEQETRTSIEKEQVIDEQKTTTCDDNIDDEEDENEYNENEKETLYGFNINLYDAYLSVPKCIHRPSDVVEFAIDQLIKLEERMKGYEELVNTSNKESMIQLCHKMKSNLYSIKTVLEPLRESLGRLARMINTQYEDMEEAYNKLKNPHPALKFVSLYRGIMLTFSHSFFRDTKLLIDLDAKYKHTISKHHIQDFLDSSMRMIHVYRIFKFLCEKCIELSDKNIERKEEENFQDPFQIYPYIETILAETVAQELSMYNISYVLDKIGLQHVKSIRRILGALVSITASQHYINEKQSDVKSNYIEKLYLSVAGAYYMWNKQEAGKNASQFFANAAIEKGSKMWNMQDDSLFKPFIHSSLPPILYSQACSIPSFASKDDHPGILFGEIGANELIPNDDVIESQESMTVHLTAMQQHFKDVLSKCEDIKKQAEMAYFLNLIEKQLLSVADGDTINTVEYNFLKNKFEQTEKELFSPNKNDTSKHRTCMSVSEDQMKDILRANTDMLLKMDYRYKRISLRLVSARPFNTELFLPFHYERRVYAYIDTIKQSVSKGIQHFWNKYGYGKKSENKPTINVAIPENYHDTDGKLMIHYHGGGFIAMSSFGHESYLRRWSNDLQIPIISVDYHKAPSCQFPALLEECVLAYKWVIQYAPLVLGCKLKTLIMAGDSAGGNLSLSVTARAVVENLRKPDLLLLTYPATNLKLVPSPARMQSMIDPLVNFGFLRVCMQAYYDESVLMEDDPFLSPAKLPDTVLEKFPPCYLNVGSLDPLLDDCVTMAKRLALAHGRVHLEVYDGLGHGYLNMLGVSKTADTVHQRLLAWTRRFLASTDA